MLQRVVSKYNIPIIYIYIYVYIKEETFAAC